MRITAKSERGNRVQIVVFEGVIVMRKTGY